jgi:hypothetical protein
MRVRGWTSFALGFGWRHSDHACVYYRGLNDAGDLLED